MLPVLLLLDALGSPSPFWNRADALCADPAALAAIEADKLGDAAEARDELFAYCKFSIAPRFAARAEADREARLATIYAALGKTPGPSPLAPPRPTDHAALAWLEKSAPKAEADDLGFAGQRILSAVVGELCNLRDAATALPTTCAAAKGSLTIAALRNAVLLDVARAVLRAAHKTTKSAELQSVAVFAWVLEHEDLGDAFDELSSLAPDPAACATSPTRTECEYASLALRLLVGITSRVLRDGPKLDRLSDHYENVVEEVLRDEAKKQDLTLPLPMKGAIRQLVESLKTAQIMAANQERATPDALQKANLDALRKAAIVATMGTALVKGGEQPAAQGFVQGLAKASADATTWLTLLAQANPRGFFDAVKPVLAAAQERGGPTANEIRALGVAASLAAAHDAADIRKAARDALVPIPAWVDRFVLDLNVAPPESKDAAGQSNFSFNGDITLGYNGDHFGFFGHADSAYYEIDQARNFALTERYTGALDVWGLINVSETVSLEPQMSLGFAYYGTLADDATTSVDRQTNQDSIMGRGSGLLGVRVRPNARIAIGAWAGAGAQYEDYYRVLQTSLGDQGTTFNAAIGVTYEARLRFQWSVWPSILSFRARGDFRRFTMRRDDQAVTVSLGQVTAASQGVIDIDQTELFARGFLDADVARFFGFVPGLHGGANVFLLSGGSGSTSVSVPVIGVGIRREAF